MTDSEVRTFLKLLVTKYISNEENRNDMICVLEYKDIPVKGILADLQKNYQGNYTEEGREVALQIRNRTFQLIYNGARPIVQVID